MQQSSPSSVQNSSPLPKPQFSNSSSSKKQNQNTQTPVKNQFFLPEEIPKPQPYPKPVNRTNVYFNTGNLQSAQKRVEQSQNMNQRLSLSKNNNSPKINFSYSTKTEQEKKAQQMHEDDISKQKVTKKDSSVSSSGSCLKNEHSVPYSQGNITFSNSHFGHLNNSNPTFHNFQLPTFSYSSSPLESNFFMSSSNHNNQHNNLSASIFDFVVKPHIESISDQKTKIIEWLKQLSLWQRAHALTYTNKEFVCLVRSMYLKKQTQLLPNSANHFIITCSQATQQFDLISIPSNKPLKYDYIQAQDQLLTNIRIMSRYTQFDSLTFNEHFLSNVEEAFHVFEQISDGVSHDLTQNDYQRLREHSRKDNSVMFYDEVEGNFRKTIGLWIVEVFMKHISMKYYDSLFTNDSKGSANRNASSSITFNKESGLEAEKHSVEQTSLYRDPDYKELQRKFKDYKKLWGQLSAARKNQILHKVLKQNNVKEMCAEHRHNIKVTKNGFPSISKSQISKVPHLLKQIVSSTGDNIFALLHNSELSDTLETFSFYKYYIVLELEDEMETLQRNQMILGMDKKIDKKRKNHKKKGKVQVNQIDSGAQSYNQGIREDIPKGKNLFYKKLEVSETHQIICISGEANATSEVEEKIEKSEASNIFNSQVHNQPRNQEQESTNKNDKKKSRKVKKNKRSKKNKNQKQIQQRIPQLFKPKSHQNFHLNINAEEHSEHSQKSTSETTTNKKTDLAYESMSQSLSSDYPGSSSRSSSCANSSTSKTHSNTMEKPDRTLERQSSIVPEVQHDSKSKKGNEDHQSEHVSKSSKKQSDLTKEDPLQSVYEEIQRENKFFQKQRRLALNRLSYILSLQKLSFKVYGSYATKTTLPSSDIDLVIDPSIVNYFFFEYSNYRSKVISSLEYLQKVFQEFSSYSKDKEQKWISNFILLPGATIPLLSFVTTIDTSINVDLFENQQKSQNSIHKKQGSISGEKMNNPQVKEELEQSEKKNFPYRHFNNKRQLKKSVKINIDITIESYVNMTDQIPIHFGFEGTELINQWAAIQEYPKYREMLKLLKVLVQNHQLNKSYHGGISSFMLAVLLAAFYTFRLHCLKQGNLNRQNFKPIQEAVQLEEKNYRVDDEQKNFDKQGLFSLQNIQEQNQQNLSVVFAQFCQFILKDFNPQTHGLDVNSERGIIFKSEVSEKGGLSREVLCVKNPLTGKNFTERCSVFDDFNNVLRQVSAPLQSSIFYGRQRSQSIQAKNENGADIEKNDLFQESFLNKKLTDFFLTSSN